MPEPVHAWKFLNQPIFAQETATNPAKKRLRVFGGLGGECFATLERLDQIRRWICVPFAHGWPLRSPPGWRCPPLQSSDTRRVGEEGAVPCRYRRSPVP